jgi:hypothetical protein
MLVCFLLGVHCGGLTWFMGKFFHFAYVDFEGSDIDSALNLFKYRCPPLKRYEGVEVRLMPGFTWTDDKGQQHSVKDFVRASKMFFKPYFGDDHETYSRDTEGRPYRTLEYLKEKAKEAGLKIICSGYY